MKRGAHGSRYWASVRLPRSRRCDDDDRPDDDIDVPDSVVGGAASKSSGD